LTVMARICYNCYMRIGSIMRCSLMPCRGALRL